MSDSEHLWSRKNMEEYRQHNREYAKEYRRKIRESGKPYPSTTWYHNHLDLAREYGKNSMRKRRLEHPELVYAVTRKSAKRRITFLDKRLYLSWFPRKGQCSKCMRKIGGGVHSTAMHHAQGYFVIFPWFGIVELCRTCHRSEH